MEPNNSTSNKTGLIKALEDFEKACFNLAHEVAGIEQESKEENALNGYPLEIHGDLREMLLAFAEYTENVRKALKENKSL